MPDAPAPTPPDDAADTLRLDDALKLAGVAATGGEAKVLIQGGAVRVNGEVETRRKRKLVEGDVVEVGDDSFEIALSDDDEEREENDVLADDEDDDEDAPQLDDAELARWASWVEDRVADDDVEAVIIRLGELHPDALEAVFARLPADVEEHVLNALDEVLERAEEDAGDDGDLPMQA
ncbi:MAG: RNA-binding S4 domain-containing protein [Trueperaceae bacterium]